MSSCLPVRIEQLCSHWMDIHEIQYFCIFRKSVEKIQVSLKSEKINRYFIYEDLSVFMIVCH